MDLLALQAVKELPVDKGFKVLQDLQLKLMLL